MYASLDYRITTSFTFTDSPQRYINFLPTFFFGANLQATWESVAVSFQAGLLNGGPTSLVYGTIIAWIGSLALAASMAEMASMYDMRSLNEKNQS